MSVVMDITKELKDGQKFHFTVEKWPVNVGEASAMWGADYVMRAVGQYALGEARSAFVRHLQGNQTEAALTSEKAASLMLSWSPANEKRTRGLSPVEKVKRLAGKLGLSNKELLDLLAEKENEPCEE
jgi:hypothetical protein